jgi:hypothetical protein
MPNDDDANQQPGSAPAPSANSPTFTRLAIGAGAPWRVTQKGQAALANAKQNSVGLAKAPGED